MNIRFGNIRFGVIVASLVGILAIQAHAAPQSPYPPSLVKSFMQGCASDPGYNDFCQCTIESLQKSMSLYDFIELGNAEGNALENDERFISATNGCLSKVKQPD
jgi:hypothetical protein